jgi:hypothetical protein
MSRLLYRLHSIGNDPVGSIVLDNIECQDKRKVWITLGQHGARYCWRTVKERWRRAAAPESDVAQIDVIEINDLSSLESSQIDNIRVLIAINGQYRNRTRKGYFAYGIFALGSLIDDIRLARHGRGTMSRRWTRSGRRARLVEALLHHIRDQDN